MKRRPCGSLGDAGKSRLNAGGWLYLFELSRKRGQIAPAASLTKADALALKTTQRRTAAGLGADHSLRSLLFGSSGFRLPSVKLEARPMGR